MSAYIQNNCCVIHGRHQLKKLVLLSSPDIQEQYIVLKAIHCQLNIEFQAVILQCQRKRVRQTPQLDTELQDSNSKIELICVKSPHTVPHSVLKSVWLWSRIELLYGINLFWSLWHQEKKVQSERRITYLLCCERHLKTNWCRIRTLSHYL